MLTPPTLDKLRALGLAGMAQALEEQLQLPDIGALSFEERLGLLVDRELTARETRRLKTRLRQATLRPFDTSGPQPVSRTSTIARHAGLTGH